MKTYRKWQNISVHNKFKQSAKDEKSQETNTIELCASVEIFAHNRMKKGRKCAET